MNTVPVIVATLSVILLSGTLTPSFALGDYDFLAEWGEFGISTPGHLSYPQFIAVDTEGLTPKNTYIFNVCVCNLSAFVQGCWNGVWPPSGFNYRDCDNHDQIINLYDKRVHKLYLKMS